MYNFNRYINTAEVAEMLKLKRNTIERWRSNRESPLPWFKIGGRVLYDRNEVLKYIETTKRDAVNPITAPGV
ncbi:MAG: helix-turn-helix domain-containing protein [Alphaproteobacteria bacterium]|nr:helix-turn-helix domain-containing protein [Alphaproteobacteria bacterium]